MSSSTSSESDEGPPAVAKSGGMEVLLLNRQRTVRADWAAVRQGLCALSSRLARSSFSVRVVSDRVIRKCNRQFRGHDKTTDVLSFPAEELTTKRPDYLGDIVISAETARRNAHRYKLALEDEIGLLALHGVLHLMGYDHERDAGEMARLEARWGRKLGLPQNLTSRARRAGGPSARRTK